MKYLKLFKESEEKLYKREWKHDSHLYYPYIKIIDEDQNFNARSESIINRIKGFLPKEMICKSHSEIDKSYKYNITFHKSSSNTSNISNPQKINISNRYSHLSILFLEDEYFVCRWHKKSGSQKMDSSGDYIVDGWDGVQEFIYDVIVFEKNPK